MGKKTTWIVVTDGAHARIAVSEGTGVKLHVSKAFEKVFDTDVPAGRDIVTDRPGRTFDSAGAGRHAMAPPTDPREVAKHNFISGVADYIDRADTAGKFHRLILVAPPRALGDIRTKLPDRVRAKVAHEINKDLTHLSAEAIGEHLSSTLDLP